MIEVTRLDGTPIVINAELVETVEGVPETIITLTTHRKVMVREPVPEVVTRMIAYQRAIRAEPQLPPRGEQAARQDVG